MRNAFHILEKSLRETTHSKLGIFWDSQRFTFSVNSDSVLLSLDVSAIVNRPIDGLHYVYQNNRLFKYGFVVTNTTFF